MQGLGQEGTRQFHSGAGKVRRPERIAGAVRRIRFKITAARLPANNGSMPEPLPPWPSPEPSHGRVRLRPVCESDAGMAMALAEDPYVSATGTLPHRADRDEARAWVKRQQHRHSEGRGFSFTIEDVGARVPVGHCGLWLSHLADGYASAGYAIAPAFRRNGFAAEALTALTGFAWSLAGLNRIDLFIEPWNAGSIRTAERSGYIRSGFRSGYQLAGGGQRDMLVFSAARSGGP